MNKFLSSNEWQYRLLRTVVQGVLGVLVANIDTIAGTVIFDPSQRALVVALVMAVLSPVMAMLGDAGGDEGDHAKGTRNGA